MISAAHQGRPSRSELGRRLMESGALSSDWVPVFAAVDRAAFLPDLMWAFVPADRRQCPDDAATTRTVTVDRRTDPDAWYGYADSDLSIVTQWDDGDHRGKGPGRVPTSSSSQPSVVFRLLAALNADDGMRVLDAGTGTAETAALLAHRCGARGVTTIDVDTVVSATARERLCAAGLYADVTVGDALAGHPANAPYDRLLCTFGVREIPASWIQQVRAGGVIVAPYGTHYSSRDAALRLTVHPDGSASGPFVAGVEFMKARAHRTVWPEHTDYVTTWPSSTGTAVQPDQLADTDAEFTISLCVPGLTHTVYREDSGTRAAWFYSLTDRSWACVRWPDEYGPGVVHQNGPRRLWDAVEAALAWWDERGRPGLTRFGLTITPEAATPWVDEPGSLLPGAQWR
ncbi:methyltransferase domain-containing protein [Streptomyces sp. NBC_00091]|uniref:methyltransferase domain-containing protein n=1 Tax=Streptomyces sp. NBC_00091 TaxID=2975648 RepID=UPI00225667BD|nr:methyltransferase domain-containing protein [Streptomyces sp. NBC_00091]MCX5377658.1 methyltransferase domain-containing protein [Streptomyces sp. NBC_00091]